MVNLVFHSNDVMYPHVLEYIYDNYKDKINDIVYKNDSNLPRYCYRSRMMKDAPSIKSIVPYECDFDFFQKVNGEDVCFHCRLENVLDSKYETMGVLGETSSSEVNVPITELGDTGSGDDAVGALDPNFLSPGQPLSIFIGANIKW